MPKISLDNLERYDGHLKDWCDARFAERKVHENWHEAGPSGAVSFYPVPNQPIDPVVNFAFTETLPEGTKGPDNPSIIIGVSSITVTKCETVGVNSTDYTVALGDTYYGGSVDLSTGIMTITYRLEEISSDPFEVSTQGNVNVFRYKHSSQLQNNILYVNNNSACTHFNYVASSSAGVDGYSFSNISLYFYSTTITTVEGFSTWLQEQKNAGTPVLIAYPIHTPQTVQLTPMQIYSLSQPNSYSTNTVYSDQQSVLVKYPKSPIVTESELDNAILSLGGD